MRAKRSKQYRKLMQQYAMSFGFREPYQVLVDAEIIQAAARFKMKLGVLLAGALHGEIKPMITQCCIRHLYDASATTDQERREKEGWIEVAKQAERRRCGHHELDVPLTTLECLTSVVDPKGSGKNRNCYVVATQDQEVRQSMRRVAGVPLMYVNRSVMILEPMASKSEKLREMEERGKLKAGLISRRPTGPGGKRKREGVEDEDMPDRARAVIAAEADGGVRVGSEPAAKKKQKVKGPKGPNPLSVRKTKKEDLKPVARQVEDERAACRTTSKRKPHAVEEGVDAEFDEEGDGMGGAIEATKKRKRKRKVKGGAAVDGEAAEETSEALTV
ncbi:hypothetical protein LTR35_005162 [Friedmanniomyces endolithicus]|nr:hypothetical protein LTR35_005162 [Friedmanniomyces endolithicus]KAK0298704.1 hypothetical protein LTS00_002466 [Friedmanniomyces endolithicus]KAK0985420.1 hypothetical protein LTR54_013815 [Friedmanniomyces endolithicus]